MLVKVKWGAGIGTNRAEDTISGITQLLLDRMNFHQEKLWMVETGEYQYSQEAKHIGKIL